MTRRAPRPRLADRDSRTTPGGTPGALLSRYRRTSTGLCQLCARCCARPFASEVTASTQDVDWPHYTPRPSERDLRHSVRRSVSPSRRDARGGPRARRRDGGRGVAELRSGATRGAPHRRPAQRAPTGGPPGRGLECDRCARRRGQHPRRLDRPAATALLCLRRLVRAGDRGDRRPARLVLRRQPGGLVGRCFRGRGPGGALGRRVHRLSGRGRRLHER